MIVALSAVLGAFFRGFQFLGLGIGFLFAFLVLFLAVLAWETCFGSGRQQAVKIGCLLLLTPLVGSFVIAPQWFNKSFALRIERHQSAAEAEMLMRRITHDRAERREVTWEVTNAKVVTIQISGTVDSLDIAKKLASDLREELAKSNLKAVGYSFFLIIRETGAFFTG